MNTVSGSCASALSTRVNRRVFLYDCGRMLGALLLPAVGGARTPAAPVRTLRVLALMDSDNESARPSLRRGMEMGADEASHTMGLFGMSLALTMQTVSNAAAAMAAERKALRGARPPSALIRAVTDGCLTPRSRTAVPTIDVACAGYETPEMAADIVPEPPNAKSPAARAGVLLHVRPSRQTILRAESSVTAAALSPAPNGRRHIELWHDSLERFGGEQLNQRYQRRFSAPMDSDAWAGWIAVKVVAESSLRAHATTPAAIGHALTDPKAQFDGHKGGALNFDSRTGELLQPLYIVDDADGARGKVVAEVLPAAR